MTGGPLSWAALAVITVVLLWVDLHFFARGREPTFREGVVWSIGWLVLSLLAAVPLLLLDEHGAEDAVTYVTVYFIERSLSLDNLFVFLLLFAYFGVPTEHRARLLFWGSPPRWCCAAWRSWAAWRCSSSCTSSSTSSACCC